MSQYTVHEQRIYEGEWWFSCTGKNHCGVLVEYSLNNYENYANDFLYSTPIHTSARCPQCGSELEWGGYSGGSPVSDRLVSLLEGGHYMAATVILSAIIESSIMDLLWAALVDNGVQPSRSNKIAGGRMNRIEAIKTIESLTDWQIQDIEFPARNLVAHGKGFMYSEKVYQNKLHDQVIQIRKWVEKIARNKTLDNFNPSESTRWLLFMSHWSNWLVTWVDTKFLCEKAPSPEGE